MPQFGTPNWGTLANAEPLDSSKAYPGLAYQTAAPNSTTAHVSHSRWAVPTLQEIVLKLMAFTQASQLQRETKPDAFRNQANR